MNRHPAPPLFADVSDRSFLRRYLLIAHLTGVAGAAITAAAAHWALGLMPLVALSGLYWWRKERNHPHPHVLKWNQTLGWRLALPGKDLPVKEIRHLVLPFCLLLEIRTERGLELLFLKNRPGMNRLRYRLRRQETGTSKD